MAHLPVLGQKAQVQSQAEVGHGLVQEAGVARLVPRHQREDLQQEKRDMNDVQPPSLSSATWLCVLAAATSVFVIAQSPSLAGVLHMNCTWIPGT